MRILLACADESLLKQTKRLMQASNELEHRLYVERHEGVGNDSTKNAGYGRAGYRPAVRWMARCVMDETE